jgi:hypothetical protein
MALLLTMMSPDSRMWFLKQRICDKNPVSAAEVPGILAQLMVVSASLNYEMKSIFELVSEIYSSFSESHKKNMIESIWHELTDHLQVQHYTCSKICIRTNIIFINYF